jgi:aspartate-semialdehyde dehydrogenase
MEHVAIVGATGAVGQEFRAVLEARRFAARSYRLLASPRSAGKSIPWIGSALTVEELTADSFRGIDLAFFSAGGSISREFVPIAKRAGAVVIDNSSAFRMDPDVPLVVPEINPDAARRHKGLIANPNCSTIIMAVVLWPLHRRSRVRRVVVSTYQAVSGAGARALAELESQTRDVLAGRPARPEVFTHPCAFNVFSHNSAIGDDGYNLEEQKVIVETRKILDEPALQIAPTCMRVPVLRAHTESLSIEFEQPITEDQARRVLADAPGVRVVDDRSRNHFPMPLDATGQDAVLVGRIRTDPSVPGDRGLQLIGCGDQLRKGAALNAVQIAELLR